MRSFEPVYCRGPYCSGKAYIPRELTGWLQTSVMTGSGYARLVLCCSLNCLKQVLDTLSDADIEVIVDSQADTARPIG